jgi:p-aminobenzoyl-glutamate transporter AbgT
MCFIIAFFAAYKVTAFTYKNIGIFFAVFGSHNIASEKSPKLFSSKKIILSSHFFITSKWKLEHYAHKSFF